MSFQALLQGFFVDRLAGQRCASSHTIAAYRDTFRLLLRFAVTRLHKSPSQLSIENLDVSFLSMFLDHLEHERGNCARTRNVSHQRHRDDRHVRFAQPLRFQEVAHAWQVGRCSTSRTQGGVWPR